MATTWIRVPLQLSEQDYERLVRAAEQEGLRPVSIARMFILRALKSYPQDKPVSEGAA